MRVTVLLLAFTACTDEVSEVQSGGLKQIVMTASDLEPEDGSRTNFKITSAGAEFSWAANDTVGIFPNEGAQAYFPMTSGAGTKNANFTGGGWALKDASTYAAYYPFIGNFYLDKNAIPVDYTGQVQTDDASTAHLGAYDYMAAAPSTPKNGNVSFAFKHLGALVQLKLTVPQVTTLSSVVLTTENESFTTKGKIDLMKTELAIVPVEKSKSFTVNLKNVSTKAVNQVATIYFMLAPTDLNGKTIKALVQDNKGNSQEVELLGKKFEAGKAYALSAKMEEMAEIGPKYHVETAGILSTLIGDDLKNTLTSLKITGNLNGDDIRFIREMAGVNEYGESTEGKLSILDISDSRLVGGGECYYYVKIGNFTYGYGLNLDKVGPYMFQNSKLTTIMLPSTAKEIEAYAFNNCELLQKVSIPNNVTVIRERAFEDCLSLINVTLPNSITSIEKHAFSSCKALKSIIIPQDVTDIADYAFYHCESLKEVVIPNKVIRIGFQTFAYCI